MPSSPKNKVVRLKSIPVGVYRHYKGNNYLVLGIARHSETEDPLVVYVRLYPRNGCPLWVRPLDNFMGHTVDARGRRVKRFVFVGASETDSK